MYVCMYVCICIHPFVYIHCITNLYVCMYVFVCVCACVHVCMYMYIIDVSNYYRIIKRVVEGIVATDSWGCVRSAPSDLDNNIKRANEKVGHPTLEYPNTRCREENRP